jgi:hypothetical protein
VIEQTPLELASTDKTVDKELILETAEALKVSPSNSPPGFAEVKDKV